LQKSGDALENSTTMKLHTVGINILYRCDKVAYSHGPIATVVTRLPTNLAKLSTVAVKLPIHFCEIAYNYYEDIDACDIYGRYYVPPFGVSRVSFAAF
jgi:hypothetical protein